MTRAFLIVLDGAGCGGAPDAADFGDAGANTLGHIAKLCHQGDAENGRHGPLAVPLLARMGLGRAMETAVGGPLPGIGSWPDPGLPGAFWGAASEVSKGKDTPSGHWELAGRPVPWDWFVFPRTDPPFSDDLVAEVARAAGTAGILGNCHAAGTAIVDRLGAAHLSSGWPICYTSVDSVFQIAAHEQAFGLDRLMALCATLAPRFHAMKLGRVIARPFLGSAKTGFQRTANRRDFAIAPPASTLCDWVMAAGREVWGIGKIGDIFSMRGITRSVKGPDARLLDHLDEALRRAPPGSLTFVNLVEFDSVYGHRRDVDGFAGALERFDRRLTAMMSHLREGDLLIVTADHGNDPTWRGTDHTRERVPVIGCVQGAATAGDLGLRAFADVAASVAAHLGVRAEGPGRSFL
ncbi:MAG: phosphopentomutase [Qingshengfaniella sp.]